VVDTGVRMPEVKVAPPSTGDMILDSEVREVDSWVRVLETEVMLLVTELESEIIVEDAMVTEDPDTEVMVLCTAVKMLDTYMDDDCEMTATTSNSLC